MNSFALFTDVSVNPQRKLGVGGYLFVPMPFLEIEPHDRSSSGGVIFLSAI